MSTVKQLVLLIASLSLVYGANILAVVPTASFSHQVFYQPLWRTLAESGHQITLVTTDPMQNNTLSNLKQIDMSHVYNYKTVANLTFTKVSEVDKVTGMTIMIDIMYAMTRLTYEDARVQSLLKDPSETYDLLLLECMLPTVFIFKHAHPNVPAICLSSMDGYHKLHEAFGNPFHAIQYPTYLLPFGEGMSFFERLQTVAFMRFINIFMDWHVMVKLQTIMEEILHMPLPYLPDIAYDMDMLFTNTNPLFNSIRPYAPATINIAGGFHEIAKQTLPEDIQTFLDDAPNGAIYFSLGSNVKSKDIVPETRLTIMKTFAELPYKVLWKFEDDHLPNKPENVKIAKWLPQQDVLRHPNIKLFITQAGMQSLEEALYANVPMVALPYMADQEGNARRMAEKGLGVDLNHKTLTVDEFKAAILEVLHNDKYRAKIHDLINLIRDQPMKPLEKAVWWIEYVLRHKGAQHLKGPIIPFWQFYYFDVLGFILLCFGVFAYVTIKITKWLFCKICKRQRKPKTE